MGESIDYVQGGVKLTIGKRATVRVPPFRSVARMTGLLFETDKAFLLPHAIKGVRKLRQLYDEHPRLAVLVNGHTDRAGDADWNLGLSEERAKAIAAYLKDDVEAWFAFYGAGVHDKKKWGTREDQHMLSALEFYAGPINGLNTEEFVQAAKTFQTDAGLDPVGKPGPKTRRELIKRYMQQDGTTLPQGVVPRVHGCGEFHNEVPTAEGVAEEKNRRVEVYFFDDEVDPLPQAKCPGPQGCAEYERWKGAATKVVDLDHDEPEPKVKSLGVRKPGEGELAAELSGLKEGEEFELVWEVEEAKQVQISDTDDQGNSLPIVTVDAGEGGKSSHKLKAEAGTKKLIIFALDGMVFSSASAPVTVKQAVDLFDVTVQVVNAEPPFGRLEDAQVALAATGQETKRTNERGEVVFVRVPRGSYPLTVTCVGFDSNTVTLEVPVPQLEKRTRSIRDAAGEPDADGDPAVVRVKPASQVQVMFKPGGVAINDDAPLKDSTALQFKKATVTLDGSPVELDKFGGFKRALSMGTHVINVTPHESERSDGVAGVELFEKVSTKDEYRKTPQYLFRPFEVVIEIDATGVKSARANVPDSAPPHVVIDPPKRGNLSIDWLPDWFRRKPVPNDGFMFGRRREIDLLVIHQTATDTQSGSLKMLSTGDTGVSAHYFVAKNGHVVKLAPETIAVAHGDGFWQVYTANDLNSRSIGIEVAHGDSDNDGGPHPFTEGQYASLTRLLTEITNKEDAITRFRVVGHSDFHTPKEEGNDFGPNDKIDDPGRMFEWERFARFVRSGKGKMPPPLIYGMKSERDRFQDSDRTTVSELQHDLRAIGYLIPQKGRPDELDPRRDDPNHKHTPDGDGVFGRYTKLAVKRFQRRFMSYSPAKDTPPGGWPEEKQARDEAFKKISARTGGLVDYATAIAIQQVLADGSPTIVKFGGAPAAPAQPATEKAVADGEGSQSIVSFEAVFVDPGDKVRVSWKIAGEHGKITLDPGGIDVSASTQDGRGSIEVEPRREQAKDGVVTYKLSLDDKEFKELPISLTHNIPPRKAGPTPAACDQCDALKKLIADGSVADKVRRPVPPKPAVPGKPGDPAAVELLQFHLKEFGYDLGTGGPGPFGDRTGGALCKFMVEAGVEGTLDVLEPPVAEKVIEKHGVGFKSAYQSPPAAGPKDQLPADALGGRAFAGLVGQTLSEEDRKFLEGFKGKSKEFASKFNEKLKLLRIIYRAYRKRGASPPVAGGFTIQFALESDFASKLAGKFNYSGIKAHVRLDTAKGMIAPTEPASLSNTRELESAFSKADIEQRMKEPGVNGQPPRYHGIVVEGGVRMHDTDEWFKDYRSSEEALDDKVKKIRDQQPYTLYDVWGSRSVEEYCRRVDAAGYSSNRGGYGPILIRRLGEWDKFVKDGGGKQVIKDTTNAEESR